MTADVIPAFIGILLYEYGYGYGYGYGYANKKTQILKTLFYIKINIFFLILQNIFLNKKKCFENLCFFIGVSVSVSVPSRLPAIL
jgi:hypothetical protein